MSENDSFLADLVRKQAMLKGVEAATGANISGPENEIKRQIKQVSRRQLGNPITGEGVTKSGEED